MDRSLSTLKDLENTLQSKLGPVHPNQDFVNKLYEKLRSDPGIVIEQKATPIVLLALGAGLIAGLLFYIFFRGSKTTE